jgi:hypothetical protein
MVHKILYCLGQQFIFEVFRLVILQEYEVCEVIGLIFGRRIWWKQFMLSSTIFYIKRNYECNQPLRVDM